ncbi:MAG: amino acid ABC transporter ATP-binding protein [Clostridiales bacterium]|nr:amino acid ABC transporter ATP-binding protein [Clostridiales bacterium]
MLEIFNLHKSFNGLHILKNISFDIHKGEVLVILGPSGSGKSTILRCINGFENIESGTIKFNGEVITTSKTKWELVRQKIGMVFQNYDLFPHMNVFENISLGPILVQKKNKSEVLENSRKLLERVGLLNRGDFFPHQLSGGQKQRVAIARALIMEPEILLFDEVTASLDPEMSREVLELIFELAEKGTTMIIVTHEMPFAKAINDRVLFLDDGEILENNSNFFNNPETEKAKRFLDIFEFKSHKNEKSD